MKCSCCERKQQSSTHVITLTPRRGSAGIHPQVTAPLCPLGLKRYQHPNPWNHSLLMHALPPSSTFLFSVPSLLCRDLPPSSTFTIFKSSAELLSTKTLSHTINRGPRWSCQSHRLYRITSYHKNLLLCFLWTDYASVPALVPCTWLLLIICATANVTLQINYWL